MPKQFCFFLLFVLTFGAAQAETPSTDESKGPQVDSIVLLSPDTSAVDRSVQLALLQASADKREAWSMYQLGTLYRLGDVHPAKVVPRDLDKARIYLSNAAILGFVKSMAGMAELEMASSRPLDGLAWAYIYLHYSRGKGALVPKKTALKNRGRGDGYDADLLLRALEAAEAAGVDRSVAGLHADAFVAKHGDAIHESLVKEAALLAKDPEIILASSDVAMLSANRKARTKVLTSTTEAVFLIRFAASGEQAALVVEDILPGKPTSKIDPLQGIARRARIKPLGPDSQPRLARMSVNFVAEGTRFE